MKKDKKLVAQHDRNSSRKEFFKKARKRDSERKGLQVVLESIPFKQLPCGESIQHFHALQSGKEGQQTATKRGRAGQQDFVFL